MTSGGGEEEETLGGTGEREPGWQPATAVREGEDAGKVGSRVHFSSRVKDGS